MQVQSGTTFDYTILGAGAVGSVIGGHLSHAGFQVQLVTTSDHLARAIACEGLRLDLDRGLQISRPHATQAAYAGPARNVILLTKTYHTRNALEAMRHVIGEETILTSLQNGVGNGAMLATCYPNNPILHGVTMLPATLIETGFVRSKGAHGTTVGPLKSQDFPHAENLAQDLNASGIVTLATMNPTSQIWQKACFNIAMNAVNAITGGGPGLIPETPELPDLVKDITLEAINVAQSEGVDINAEDVFSKIEFACREHRFHKPSMLQDVLSKRPTEVDALNGKIVELAAKHRLPAPMNRLLTGLIHGIERAENYWAGMPD